jgi:hypothetical protein
MRFGKRPSEAERCSWRSVATVACLTLAMTLGLWTVSPGSVSAEDRHISLYVTSVGGWSDTPGGGIPGGDGPALAVVQGDNVTITLESEDIFEHGLFIDYNKNNVSDEGDFISEVAGPFERITFSFTPLTPGVFDYCDQFFSENCGTWTTIPNAAPVAEILAPGAGASWTAGFPHDIVFNVSDPDGDAVVVALSYSYNGGASRGSIPGPIPIGANPNRYRWTPSGFHGPDTVVHLEVQDPHGSSTVLDSPVFEVDGTAPTIVSITPAVGATSVDRGTDIVVNWSEQMDPASAAPDAFGVRVQGGPWIAGSATLSPDGTDMVFDSAAPLSEATTYEVHVNTTARDTSDPGNPFAGPYTWAFTTSAAVVDIGLPAPATVSATESNGVVEITWSPVLFPGLRGYHVYRGESDAGPFQRLTPHDAPVPPTATVYRDEPPAGRTYFYTVRAVSETGAESPNGPLDAVTIPPYQEAPLFDPGPWALAFLTLGLIMGALYATSLFRRRFA